MSTTQRIPVRNLIAAVALVMSIVLVASPVHAVVIPVGLNPGDPYHLVFVTRGFRDAASSDIADYNTFVNTEAALNPSLTGTDVGVQWFAIASTGAVDARDNAVVSAPVYQIDGSIKVADGSGDMWDGSIDNRISLDQFEMTLFGLPWTGSGTTGVESPLGALGDPNARTGDTGEFTTDWISDSTLPTTELLPLYALSEQFTAPEPATFALAVLGLLGLLAYASRRRRKA